MSKSKKGAKPEEKDIKINEEEEITESEAVDTEEDSEEKTKELNAQLHFLQEKLVEYLNEINAQDVIMNPNIRRIIYTPFERKDISIERQIALDEHIDYSYELDDEDWEVRLGFYGMDGASHLSSIHAFKDDVEVGGKSKQFPDIYFLLPKQIMLLNFNYTNTAKAYLKDNSPFTINQIHGRLDEPASVIFGYGDEMDEKYKELLNKNDNECLTNIKSIKYLEADNYRKMLSFIEAEPFQVFIMGHSCGNSDRTLLNTLFEHPNCVSIKPYYYVKDDGSDTYLDIVQNISRNFTDMKKMRDRVVNKIYCEPLPQNESEN